jgi:hypothetical protein
VASRHGEQRRARGEQHQQRGKRHTPPVAHVGNVAGIEREGDVRKHFSETDEAKREWIARELVDLPPHHHRLHLRRERHREDAHDEPAKGWLAKRGVWVVMHEQLATLVARKVTGRDVKDT